jgi:hypothetical protein
MDVNDAAAFYFLSEPDALPGGKQPSSRKGKGEEKLSPTTYFPLLTSLDRDPLLKSPAMIGRNDCAITRHSNSATYRLKELAVLGQPEASSSSTQPTAGATTTSEASALQPAPSNEQEGRLPRVNLRW